MLEKYFDVISRVDNLFMKIWFCAFVYTLFLLYGFI